MLDTQSTVQALFAVAAAAPGPAAADQALSAVLAPVREWMSVRRIQADALVMMRTWSPDSGPLGLQAAAARLAVRLDEVELARRFGDPADVQRVIDLTLRELRESAVAAAAR
jgi:hypothetical protein